MTVRTIVLGALLLSILPPAGCGTKKTTVAADPLHAAYDSEPDWNDAQHVIPLNYQQAQGSASSMRSASGAMRTPRPQGRRIAQT